MWDGKGRGERDARSIPISHSGYRHSKEEAKDFQKTQTASVESAAEAVSFSFIGDSASATRTGHLEHSEVNSRLGTWVVRKMEYSTTE